jgi:RND family efflux transporter MFP subunit
MRSIWSALKGLAAWQVLVLIIVLFGAAGATYGGYIRANGAESVELAEDQQLIPIRYGNLVNEVSTSGNLAFPDREMLTFGSGGTVSELNVEEGMPVSRGQVLASLDTFALASLEETKAQAEFDLQAAVEALDETKLIDPLLLAEAHENVAAARLALEEALDALEDAREPHTVEEIESQRRLVADTELTLQNVRRALSDLELGHEVAVNESRQDRAGARVSLEEAKRELIDFAPSYKFQVVQARQAFADAEAGLDAAVASLSDFNPSYSESLAQSRQAEADAMVAVEEARNVLKTFHSTYDQQLAQAKEVRADKELGLQEAVDALDELTSGHSRNLVEARQAASDAQIALEQATAAVERFERSNRSRIENLVDEREELETSLQETRLRLDNLLLAQDQGAGGLGWSIYTLESGKEILEDRLAEVEEALADWTSVTVAEELAQRDLDDARAELVRLEKGLDPLAVAQQSAVVELARTELQTAIDDVQALDTQGGSLRRGQLEAAVALAQERYSRTSAELTELESGPNSAGLRQLEEEVVSARSEVSQAVLELGYLIMPAGPDVVSAWQLRVSLAEAAVIDAEVAPAGDGTLRDDGVAAATAWLATARDILAAISQGANPHQLTAIEAKAALAQSRLAEAQAELVRLGSAPDPIETEALQAQEAHLTVSLEQAREDLAELLEAPDSVTISLKEAQIVLAKASLADSEESLAELRLGPDSYEISLLEARVRTATLAVEEAGILLSGAVMRAPFDGFVSQALVERGDDVDPDTQIVEIVDPTVVEVDGIVDEIDVLSIRLGTAVKVTVDAVPGETIEGTVTQISPEARNQQGVVTYPITIQVDVRPGLDLREGLSAVASIVLREERDVLLVPQQALYGTFDEPVVKVLNSTGALEDRSVALGASDDFWVSVKEGVKEGDQVAMEGSEVGTSQFSFRQFRRVTGGGGPSSRGGRR